MFVRRKPDSNYVAGQKGVIIGMQLTHFRPAGMEPMEIDELINSKGQSYTWGDLHNLVKKHQKEMPHEYTFSLDRSVKMMTFVLNTRNCVSKTRNCVFKMMTFPRQPRQGGEREAQATRCVCEGLRIHRIRQRTC